MLKMFYNPWSLTFTRFAWRIKWPSRRACRLTKHPKDNFGSWGIGPIQRRSFRTTIFNNCWVNKRPLYWGTHSKRNLVCLLFSVPRGNNSPVTWTFSVSKRSCKWDAISEALFKRISFCIAAFPCPHALRARIALTTGLLTILKMWGNTRTTDSNQKRW